MQHEHVENEPDKQDHLTIQTILSHSLLPRFHCMFPRYDSRITHTLCSRRGGLERSPGRHTKVVWSDLPGVRGAV